MDFTLNSNVMFGYTNLFWKIFPRGTSQCAMYSSTYLFKYVVASTSLKNNMYYVVEEDSYLSQGLTFLYICKYYWQYISSVSRFRGDVPQICTRWSLLIERKSNRNWTKIEQKSRMDNESSVKGSQFVYDHMYYKPGTLNCASSKKFVGRFF